MNLNKKWITLAALCSVLITVILFAAYFGKIPNFIGAIPYYDKIGHIVLYGIWSYIFWRVSNRKILFNIPLAPAAITVFTVVEEYLQILSPNRTASISDLIFSLAGIWLVILLDRK